MKLLLLGDVSPTANNAELFCEGDLNILFGDTLSLFEQADFRVCNLECAITEAETGITKFGPCLKAPIKTAEVLRRVGIDLCGLSNNHVFDYGKDGMKDTFAALKEQGIAYTGFGDNYEDSRRNYIIEKDGKRIAVIAVSEHEYSYALDNRMGARPFDPFDTPLDVRAAKESCDRVIVLYHGGKEFCEYPSPRLHHACRTLVECGADVVLCQHSHCIGCYEEYKGSHILYGQGNFHFVKIPAVGPEHLDMWNNSLAVLYDTESGKITFTPVECGEKTIHLTPEIRAAKVLEDFRARSASLADGKWREGWHDFCVRMSAGYLSVIRNAALEDSTEKQNANFAHYLDCEAHTDVWRELFPTYNQTNCLED